MLMLSRGKYVAVCAETICMYNDPTLCTYTPIAFDESNFLASTCQVTALCLRVYCIICVCDCVMVIRKPMHK